MLNYQFAEVASRLQTAIRRKKSTPFKPIKKPSPQRVLLAGFVLLTVSLLAYFYLIGRNRYQVISSVLVRKATDTSIQSVTLGSLLSGGNQQSLEDARFLQTYLTSPQVMEDLEKKIDFRVAYAREGLDPFPGVWQGATREQVFDVFRRQINVGLDEVSGEVRIRTLAFNPETALQLNGFLIGQSEILVNRLNQDVYRQQLGFVQKQVELNAQRVRKETLALQDFQRNNNLLDAKAVATRNEVFIGELEGELAILRVELVTLQRKFTEPDAPEIEAVQAEVQALQQQITQERTALVSPTGKNLNEKLLKLAELEANLTFATDLYKAAIGVAEKTRVDSLQQQRFMAVLSKPLLPEEPWQYWRHKGFLTALATMLVGFSLTKFFLGMADSHRN